MTKSRPTQVFGFSFSIKESDLQTGMCNINKIQNKLKRGRLGMIMTVTTTSLLSFYSELSTRKENLVIFFLVLTAAV